MRTLRSAGFVALAALAVPDAGQRVTVPDVWTRDFHVEPGELASTGRNPYFILEPGYALLLADGAEQLTITVLDETRTLGGVDTRIVEERETNGGRLVEVSRNYYAISTRTNSVFYFGEDVDMYTDGRVTSHEGSWIAGVGKATFGLMMPGLPLVGARYYQEVAEGTALDRAEVAGLTDTLRTPAGNFTGVLRTIETSPLEPAARETKYYGRGVGLLQEGPLKLVQYGRQQALGTRH